MSVARRAALNFSVRVASLVVTLIERVVLTGVLIRAWGADPFAEWVTLGAATAMLGITELGFQTFLGNMLVRAENRGRDRAFQRLVSNGITFYLGTLVVLLAVIAGFAAFGNIRGYFDIDGMAHAEAVFVLLALTQVLRVTRNGVTQILRGKGAVHQLIWASVRSLMAGGILAVIAGFMGASPLVIAILYLLAEAVFGFAWSILLVRRRYSGIRLHIGRPSRREMLATVGNLRWYGMLVIITQTMTNIPILLMTWIGIGGPLLVSFVVQRTLVNVGRTISESISQALGIELAGAAQRPGSTDYREGVFALGRINAALAALLTAGLLCFGEAVIGIWTGDRDLGSLLVLAWLLLPIIFLAPAIPVQMVSLYGGEPRPQAIAGTTYVVLGIGLSLLAGTRFGVVGVAFGVGVGETVGMAIVLPALAARKLGIPYRELLLQCLALFVGAAIWALGIGWALARLISAEQTPLILLMIFLWLILAAIPVLLFSLPRRLRTNAMALLGKSVYRGRKLDEI